MKKELIKWIRPEVKADSPFKDDFVYSIEPTRDIPELEYFDAVELIDSFCNQNEIYHACYMNRLINSEFDKPQYIRSIDMNTLEPLLFVFRVKKPNISTDFFDGANSMIQMSKIMDEYFEKFNIK